MDPAATLKRIEGHIKAAERASDWRAMQHFTEAAHGLDDYWDWRKRGGLEPKGGDARARKLGERFTDAFEKHQEEEERDRAVHQDFEANPKGKTRSKKKKTEAMDQEAMDRLDERGEILVKVLVARDNYARPLGKTVDVVLDEDTGKYEVVRHGDDGTLIATVHPDGSTIYSDLGKLKMKAPWDQVSENPAVRRLKNAF